jgi:hypothetical protein
MLDIQLITILKVATIILATCCIGGAFFVWVMPDEIIPDCTDDNSVHDLGMLGNAHKEKDNEAY